MTAKVIKRYLFAFFDFEAYARIAHRRIPLSWGIYAIIEHSITFGWFISCAFARTEQKSTFGEHAEAYI